MPSTLNIFETTAGITASGTSDTALPDASTLNIFETTTGISASGTSDTALPDASALNIFETTTGISASGVGLTYSSILVLSPGSVSLQSPSCSVKASRAIYLSQTSCLITRFDANASIGKALIVDTLGLEVSYLEAGIEVNRGLSAESEIYELNRLDATVSAVRVLSADSALYELNRLDATVSAGRVLSAESEGGQGVGQVGGAYEAPAGDSVEFVFSDVEYSPPDFESVFFAWGSLTYNIVTPPSTLLFERKVVCESDDLYVYPEEVGFAAYRYIKPITFELTHTLFDAQLDRVYKLYAEALDIQIYPGIAFARNILPDTLPATYLSICQDVRLYSNTAASTDPGHFSIRSNGALLVTPPTLRTVSYNLHHSFVPVGYAYGYGVKVQPIIISVVTSPWPVFNTRTYIESLEGGEFNLSAATLPASRHYKLEAEPSMMSLSFIGSVGVTDRCLLSVNSLYWHFGYAELIATRVSKPDYTSVTLHVLESFHTVHRRVVAEPSSVGLTRFDGDFVKTGVFVNDDPVYEMEEWLTLPYTKQFTTTFKPPLRELTARR